MFGIVQQCGGSIWVYSEPGNGTAFKIYLPRTQRVAKPESIIPEPMSLEGTETILLVEDQDDVRAVAHQILCRYGYHVLEARSAAEALLACERHPHEIHLLLTDVVLPQMNGRELAKRLLNQRPQLRVLFMSGYTDNAIVHNGVLDSGAAYLQKPLVPERLGRRIREVRDTPLRSPVSLFGT